MKINKAIVFLLISLLTLSACTSAQKADKVDLNALTLEELVKKAKEDGELNTVGMPDSWANWGETWTEFTEIYGISHTDVDMSSGEELAIFEAEKANATKDLGDVGQSFGPVAVERGLTQPYKTSYWDSVPSYAKDENGHWIIAYYGTMSFLANKDRIKKMPTSFKEILDGDYKVSLGNVVSGTSSQCAVLSAAMAFGGSESDLQPAIDFFKKLAEQGRLDKGEFNIARLEKGEIDLAITWDYLSLGYRDKILKNNANANFEVCIPKDGAIQSGYCTVINKFTKRPYAAALAREYILSDEGQINLAKGYARPIREDVELPEEVQNILLPSEQYKNARMIEDSKGWEKSVESLKIRWPEDVMAYTK